MLENRQKNESPTHSDDSGFHGAVVDQSADYVPIFSENEMDRRIAKR